MSLFHKQLPILQRAFNRLDWTRFDSDLDKTILEKEIGIEKIIEIANRLIIDDHNDVSKILSKPKNIFVSRAKEDRTTGNAIAEHIKKLGVNVLLGDDSIKPNQMVEISIIQAILKCDICIILWSKYYALSPWCYDELILAIEQQSTGNLKILIFNIDDSLIVPKEARKLKVFKVKTQLQINSILDKYIIRK